VDVCSFTLAQKYMLTYSPFSVTLHVLSLDIFRARLKSKCLHLRTLDTNCLWA